MAFSLDQFYRLNRRALIWVILAALLWLMRDFFGLVFMTFILAFMATALATFGERRLHLTRRISLLIVYGLFLAGLVSFVRFVTPSVASESVEITKKLPEIQSKIIEVKNQVVASHPSLDQMLTDYLRSVLPEKELQKVDDQLETLHIEPTSAAALAAQDHVSSRTLTPATMRALPAIPDANFNSGVNIVRHSLEQELLLKAWMGMLADKVRHNVPLMINVLTRMSGTLLLALLFSFLITMDIARLREELDSLRLSRLRDFYEQAAQPVVRFAYVLGRAFQAQAAIAFVNALMTLIGMAVLGIPSLAALTLIVFLCGFIPVLGVFLYSAPIVLVALNSGGLSKAVATVVMIVITHFMIYLVIPFIYGRHLKLNPVLVLLILYIGDHAFGLWGMLLGVPVAYYFIHDVFGVPVWNERRDGKRGVLQTAPLTAGAAAVGSGATETEPMVSPGIVDNDATGAHVGADDDELD